MLLLRHWEALLVTIAFESLIGLTALVIVTKGERMRYLFKGLAVLPVRYALIASRSSRSHDLQRISGLRRTGNGANEPPRIDSRRVPALGTGAGAVPDSSGRTLAEGEGRWTDALQIYRLEIERDPEPICGFGSPTSSRASEGSTSPSRRWSERRS